MPDLRNSTALRQLTDLGGHEPYPPDWVWAVARLELSGRLLLPVEARDALRAGARGHGDAIGMCHGAALVLRSSGHGRPLAIDGRGRLYVPVWLRRTQVSCLLVGTHAAASVVVVAPVSVLDGLGDQLVGEAR